MGLNWQTVLSWRGESRAEKWLRLGAVLALFVLINHLSFRHHGSIDCTRNHRFSLDAATQRFLGGLNRELSLIALFSSGSDIYGEIGRAHV